MQRSNVFSGPYLDRAAHLRSAPEWFAAALADERSRVIPVWNSCNLVEGDPPRAAPISRRLTPARVDGSGFSGAVRPQKRKKIALITLKVDG
jgi:hypothetical protein